MCGISTIPRTLHMETPLGRDLGGGGIHDSPVSKRHFARNFYIHMENTCHGLWEEKKHSTYLYHALSGRAVSPWPPGIMFSTFLPP